MKKMSKFISVLLCLCLCASMFPANALAVDLGGLNPTGVITEPEELEDSVVEESLAEVEAPAEAPETDPVEPPVEEAIEESVEVIVEAPASDGATSGTCGDNLTWTLSDDGVLTISGTGDMTNYSNVASVPWYSMRSSITSVVIQSGVISIGGLAFHGCDSLAGITIPDSVTSIGLGAFSYCTSLVSVALPNSITSIGAAAFTGCDALTDINIPDGVTTISDCAFDLCTSLTSITIPGTVTKFGGTVFSGCCGLTNVIIMDGISEIVGGMFQFCDGLVSISIPKSVTTIGPGAFEGCNKLTAVNYSGREADWATISIGENNTPLVAATIVYAEIASGTCGDNLTWMLDSEGLLTISGSGIMARPPWNEYREIITSVVIESGVTNISSNAFNTCRNLTSIAIPDSITSIGKYAFEDCDSLTDVHISNVAAWCGIDFAGLDSNPLFYADKLYLNGELITSLLIPDSVTSISDSLFRNCSSLTSVIIPDSVTSIGSYAFLGCGKLTSIIIPESVISIGNSAFYGCSNLKHVVYIGTAENLAGVDVGSCNTPLTGLKPCFVDGGSIFAVDEDCVSTYQLCPVCEEHFAVATKTGGAHSWSDWTQTKAPTIAGEGEEQRTCSACGVVETQTINRLGQPCGENVYWLLKDDVLTISGTGAMSYYGVSGYAPWYNFRSSITSIVIDAGVTHIGDFVFSGCNELTNVIIPDGVIDIGMCAFSGCNKLTSVTIPEGVKNIGEGVFSGCNSLTSVIIPNSVTFIGDYAFSDCSGLTSISIPESVTSISTGAFNNCSKLTSITIPDGVTYIGGAAFHGCNGLVEMTIPFVGGSSSATTASAKSLFGYIFGTSSYEGGIETTQFYSNSYSKTYYIPDNLRKVTVTGGNILYGAFYGCSELTDIILPDDLASIDGFAFSHCSRLASITIPDGVASIGDSAFQKCSSLKNLSIPENVTNIASCAFQYCTNLTNIIIPEGVERIEMGLFDGCSSLANVAIQGEVTSIGDNAFASCSALTCIILPGSVVSIGCGAFNDCSCFGHALYIGTAEDWANVAMDSTEGYDSWPEGLIPCFGEEGDIFTDEEDCLSSWIQCPVCEEHFAAATKEGGAHSWGEWTETKVPTFAELGEEQRSCSVCGAVESQAIYCPGEFCGESVCWSLEDGVLTISGTGAMADYNSSFHAPWYDDRETITSVVINDGVTHIGSNAICGCSNLKSVSIPDSVTSIGPYAFPACSSLSSISLPDGVDSLEGTFSDCSGLTRITLPEQLAIIGHGTFQFCDSLVSINIPENVTSIGDCAFWDCSGLTSITIPASVTSIGKYAFDGCTSLEHLLFIGTEDQWWEMSIGSYNTPLTDIEPCYGMEDDAIINGEDCLSTWVHCSVCNEKFNVETKDGGKHSWGDWIETKAPTITEEGEEKRECSGCGATESRPKYLLAEGDVNGDEEITIADAVRIARYDAGYVELTETQLAAADVNGDGDVTIADAVRIARYDAGYIAEL